MAAALLLGLVLVAVVQLQVRDLQLGPIGLALYRVDGPPRVAAELAAWARKGDGV